MSILIDESGVVRTSKSVRGEQLQKKRAEGIPCLFPLVGDGPITKALIDEIQGFMSGSGGDRDDYRDQIPGWEKRLREARYKDWLAAR